ncbi:MAG: hypothetical protein ACFE0Q_16745 [Anaerolineae bacterium]
MSNSTTTNNLTSHIQRPDTSQWDESRDAMQNYLSLLKQHAEQKSEKAEEQLAVHEEDLEQLKLKRRKRRNYGTRTGIVLQDGTDTNITD